MSYSVYVWTTLVMIKFRRFFCGVTLYFGFDETIRLLSRNCLTIPKCLEFFLKILRDCIPKFRKCIGIVELLIILVGDVRNGGYWFSILLNTLGIPLQAVVLLAFYQRNVVTIENIVSLIFPTFCVSRDEEVSESIFLFVAKILLIVQREFQLRHIFCIRSLLQLLFQSLWIIFVKLASSCWAIWRSQFYYNFWIWAKEICDLLLQQVV
eukprot:TRINITY_DN3116_c1_g4_i3.p2 TRINITY_DN3116_c1_g4~~TRINITY_DN3116_c1_g4_i3.p2  ORF type:complete len:209 (-),score=-5.85 TRINITY_DN3116_c1_g4_i3:41-667(-)